MRVMAAVLGLLAMLSVASGAKAEERFGDGSDYSFSLASQEGETEATTETTYEETSTTYSPILWDGFLWGNRHFRYFPRPVSMPIYFEDPFINSDLRLLYVWHNIPKNSELRGGEVQVWAAQIRLALTERLQFIATKDGYTKMQTGITPDGDGWNDFAIGLKYALLVDEPNNFILSTGFRWEWDNGHAFALQGNEHELSPFVSFAKSWDKFHLIGNVNWRIPTNRNQGVHSLTWHLHFDYEVLPNFYPLVEFNGIHWLTEAERLPLSVEYLDVGNIGSSRVAGRDFFSVAAGFRWQLCDYCSFGTTYEFPLESQDENIEQSRLTFNIVVGL